MCVLAKMPMRGRLQSELTVPVWENGAEAQTRRGFLCPSTYGLLPSLKAVKAVCAELYLGNVFLWRSLCRTRSPHLEWRMQVLDPFVGIVRSFASAHCLGHSL
jgi:hypothetical protein